MGTLGETEQHDNKGSPAERLVVQRSRDGLSGCWLTVRFVSFEGVQDLVAVVGESTHCAN